ncbi:hypothetical protein Xszus_02231 [Xenorhabdus szentirmaii]|uniref:Uncharacterized protein n=1 Tax=Xenorhabdus szentirmaii DSM 16338 TaxID=1427518 RepID=W1IXW3_9GAMM|nr:hypothetical protein Xsze_00142 [Xenorhabdus szentirmaii DSM 16338]PHM42494.1 hypothetical protein Xszus_02231 [Xenorhabdus szentirmaii]CDL83294.1 hypothetical protein XSR1_30148 [Xenorhabdus szentirmaii DSM 16338]
MSRKYSLMKYIIETDVFSEAYPHVINEKLEKINKKEAKK